MTTGRSFSPPTHVCSLRTHLHLQKSRHWQGLDLCHPPGWCLHSMSQVPQKLSWWWVSIHPWRRWGHTPRSWTPGTWGQKLPCRHLWGDWHGKERAHCICGALPAQLAQFIDTLHWCTSFMLVPVEISGTIVIEACFIMHFLHIYTCIGTCGFYIECMYTICIIICLFCLSFNILWWSQDYLPQINL